MVSKLKLLIVLSRLSKNELQELIDIECHNHSLCNKPTKCLFYNDKLMVCKITRFSYIK
jgi:hypothetical protein